MATLITLSSIILIIFLLTAFSQKKRTRSRDSTRSEIGKATEKKTNTFRFCPLCQSELVSGQRVKTVVYPGKPDKRAEVYGCPYCYPANHKTSRVCPVCKKELPEKGFLYGRYFEQSARKHLHILGCPRCYTLK